MPSFPAFTSTRQITDPFHCGGCKRKSAFKVLDAATDMYHYKKTTTHLKQTNTQARTTCYYSFDFEVKHCKDRGDLKSLTNLADIGNKILHK